MDRYSEIFTTYDIDEYILELAYGVPMTFKVGDKVRYTDFSSRESSLLPGGTVLLFPSGDAHVLNNAGSVLLFRTGMITELGEVSKTEPVFTVLFIPEPEPAVSERDELAFEIYKGHLDIDRTTTYPDAKSFRDGTRTDFWSFKAADYVLANFVRKPVHPDLIDGDSDLWRWDEIEESYWCVDGHLEARTRSSIERNFGPVKEVI